MSSRFRALCALLLVLPLGGCLGLAASGINAVAHIASGASTGLAVAGAVGQMNAQDRACASMTPSERRTATVQDRVTCERVWAQTSDPNATTDCVRADRRIAEWRRRWPADPSAQFQYNPIDAGCPSVQQAFRDRGMTPPGGATLVSTPRR